MNLEKQRIYREKEITSRAYTITQTIFTVIESENGVSVQNSKPIQALTQELISPKCGAVTTYSTKLPIFSNNDLD